MARTVQQIIDQMNAAKTAEADLNGLNSPSQTAIYTLWIYIQALQQYFIETIIGVKQAEIETTVNSAVVPSEPWLQRKVLEFQYSATVPQIIQLINFVPSYPVIDTTLRIISRCSVKTNGQRIVDIKVATGEPPVALSGPQLSALSGYLTQGGDGTISGSGTGISYAGVQINTLSYDADRLYLKGVITYNGQYSSTIQATVIAAIDSYLSSIPFDGQVKVLELTDAIQQVPGVNDIKIEDFAMRADLGTRTFLIQAFTQALTLYPTFAGYIIQEDNSGETFTDTLTFVAA